MHAADVGTEIRSKIKTSWKGKGCGSMCHGIFGECCRSGQMEWRNGNGGKMRTKAGSGQIEIKYLYDDRERKLESIYVFLALL